MQCTVHSRRARNASDMLGYRQRRVGGISNGFTIGAMTWIGWNNSEKHSSGAGYGFKIDRAERDRNFKPEWQQITVELPTPRGINAVSVNVGKSSFWKNCPELISKDIGRWMLEAGYAPWPKRRPPEFEVEPSGVRTYRVLRARVATRSRIAAFCPNPSSCTDARQRYDNRTYHGAHEPAN